MRAVRRGMPGMAATDGRITGRAFVTGLVLSAVFA